MDSGAGRLRHPILQTGHLALSMKRRSLMIRMVQKTALVPLLLAGWAGLARGDDPPAPEARPYLGVMLAPVPEALRAHLKIEDGVLLQEIVPGGPADKAGLRLY